MTYKLTDGVITIATGGKEIKLVCNVAAAVAISKKFGGIYQALQKCAIMDYAAYMEIIECGVGRELTATETKALFEAGSEQLVEWCYTFIETLQNGGKARPSEEAKEVEKPAKGKP
jgi:hypothetical protein